MQPPAKLDDLIDALEFDFDEQSAWFDRETGRVVRVDQPLLRAVEDDDQKVLGDGCTWPDEEVELARAIVNDQGGRFIAAPDKFDFHEYRHMERFIGTLPDEQAADELWRAIKGKGAFRYFKDTAGRLGLLDQWYRYRDDAVKRFVLDWAEANQIAVEGQVPRIHTN